MFDDCFNNDLTSFFGRDMSDFFNRNQNRIMPAVNIKEVQDNLQIEVAAPGLRKEDFQLHLENNVLTVSAQKETRSGFEPSAANQNNDQNQNSSTTEDGTVNQTSGATTTSEAGANQNIEISGTSGDASTGVQTATPSSPQRYTR